MKNLFFNTVIFFLFIYPFCTASAQKFKINGTTIGIKDSTWIFIRKGTSDVKIDSSLILNDRFLLQGNIDDDAVEMILYTANYENYTTLWVEPKEITINVKAEEFKKAIIKGSITQTEAENFKSKLSNLTQLQDSLSNLLKGKKGKETIDIWDKLKAIRVKEQDLYQDYVANNLNSFFATNILYVYASTWGKAKTKELYQNLTKAQKSSSFGKGINEYLVLNQEIKIGNKFADFEQTNTIGKKVKLSAIKAKYILLEFWGSWCGPCREENPNLVKTYNAYKSKGFEILGVAADNNKEHWLKAINDDQLPWENVSDLKGNRNEAVVIYGVNAFPTSYLIDDKGIIIAKNLSGEALRKKLAELLP